MKEEDKLDDDDKEFLAQHLDSRLDMQKIEAELEALVENLSEDADLEMSLDLILDKFLEDVFGVDKSDLAQMLGRYFDRSLAKRRQMDKKGKIKTVNMQKLIEHLQRLAVFYKMQRSFVQKLNKQKQAGEKLEDEKSAQGLASKKDKKNLKAMLKRAVIYECYKAMNPCRIAGETVRENFEDNVVLRGMRKAIKQEGSAAKDTMSKFTTKELSNLQKRHKDFKRGGGQGFSR